MLYVWTGWINAQWRGTTPGLVERLQPWALPG